MKHVKKSEEESQEEYMLRDSVLADESEPEPEEIVEQKKPKNQTAIVIVVIAIAIVVVIALLLTPRLLSAQMKAQTLDEMHAENYRKAESPTNYIYNGFSFLKLPDEATNVEMWYTQYAQGNVIYDIPMRYGPREVDNVPKVIISPIPPYNYTQIVITIDPEPPEVQRQYLTLSVSEFSRKLTQVKEYPLSAACTRNETFACATRPIVTCDADAEDIIVYFVESDDTRITVHGACITISGRDEDLLRATYRVVYELLGIIKP